MGKKQYWTGFQLLSELEDSGLRSYPTVINQAITARGVCIFSAGYLTVATTLQGVILAGVATVAYTAAQAVASGTLTEQVIPCLPQYRFMVPVEANALITQAAVGTLVDLQSVNTIDISDTVTLGYGFMIEEIDASAAAVAANAYGFAIGHFEYQAAS